MQIGVGFGEELHVLGFTFGVLAKGPQLTFDLLKPSLSREPGEDVWKGGWFYGASADWTGALDIGTLVGLGGGFEYTAKAETEDGLGADKEGIFLRVVMKGLIHWSGHDASRRGAVHVRVPS